MCKHVQMHMRVWIDVKIDTREFFGLFLFELGFMDLSLFVAYVQAHTHRMSTYALRRATVLHTLIILYYRQYVCVFGCVSVRCVSDSAPGVKVPSGISPTSTSICALDPATKSCWMGLYVWP